MQFIDADKAATIKELKMKNVTVTNAAVAVMIAALLVLSNVANLCTINIVSST